MVKEDVVTEGVNKVEGLAVDWVGGNLYWSDEGLQAILVTSLESPGMRKTLVQQNTSNVRSLTVSPHTGLMFWSVWNNIEGGTTQSGTILWSWMDGTNIQTVVNTELQWPNGLVFDSPASTLYWCDTFLNKVESIHIGDSADLASRRVILAGDRYTSRPYGVTLNKNQLYWTEFINGNIIKHDLETNITSTLIKNNPQLFELKYYSPNNQKDIKSKCKIGDCSELCLLTPSAQVCACTDGFTLNEDQKNCDKTDISVSECAENEFKCSSAVPVVCLSKDKVCNGVQDCPDGSDEQIGDTCFFNVTCSMEEFACVSTTQCVSRLWICDGDKDCRDGSDESPEACTKPTCDVETEFMCSRDKVCVPSSWECDGVPDCQDASDEHPGCFNTTCLHSQFLCDASKCIPEDFKCDGEDDCEDGSDEAGCPRLCGPDSFFCSVDRRCIPGNSTCNGQMDCTDGEDERECPTQLLGRCEPTEFSCGDGTCLPGRFLCDGSEDCMDGSDENHGNCSLTCSRQEKACSSGQKCISTSFWCDGDEDCDDGSDEINCPKVVLCPYPNLQCDSALNKTKCIKTDRVCNGVQDCKDGSDEGLLCSEKQCESKVNTCSNNCTNSPDGHRCSCPVGQHLDRSLTTCTELHPCNQWGTCSQLCKQVKGV